MSEVWYFITGFGDSAVTLPLALVVTAYLACIRLRMALPWVVAIGGGGGLIAIVKLLLRGCLANPVGFPLVSPSGHTAMSVAVYGCLACLAARQVPARFAPPLFLLAAAWVCAIGISRLVLAVHTPVEVAVGFLVGLCAVAGFWLATRNEKLIAQHLRWLAAASIAIVAFMHGTQWPIESALRSVAFMLRGNLPGCG